MLRFGGRLADGDQIALGKMVNFFGTDRLLGGSTNGGIGGRPYNMTSIGCHEPACQQRDTRFDPAVVLTWMLGMAVAVFIATAL